MPMTRDDLLAALAAAEATAAGLRRLLDEIDGAPTATAPSIMPDRQLETTVAARIMKCGYSTAYRRARAYGLGCILPTGAWRFSERAVRAFAAGRDENGEDGDVRHL